MSDDFERKWIRLWVDFGDDPKVQLWPKMMQRHFIYLLLARARNLIPNPNLKRLAKYLDISLTKLNEVKNFFLKDDNPVIDENWEIVQWNKRQYVSDISTLRTRKHRDKGTFPERSMEQHGNGLDTDTETDTKTETEEETEYVLDFPIKDKTKKYLLTQSKINEWQELFPDMDVLIECKHLRQWMLESQDNYRSNIPNFVRNCLKASYNDPKKRYTKRKSNVYIP